ncbi:2-succinyl-6-hydroxy-2,4-cyclohexadiene-1-carboxylate synthase [Bacillus aerolatus]|uniref:Putative 2-succinyl-6-hydroxy-2,4-cyclohexadiene-1-carboxylate synthase n=1 Tax=Bacillus aerolatus TaxID=2653354 RepID=A0A6I1FE45_9BACI|nr:2-succinyl-6-hydroxy-2,4-cyclohexadiene-1-carboxylate synthase [Bacillus aerolatus]KAB7706012.1 2-succinyl-6-hydroxy-2,4-cyclohexadiene-1-carboxylate synthase [Bacillus aerolatus]
MIGQCRYHVEVTGSGEPMLLLHGFTGSSSTWSETVAFLKEDYQCIAVDLIGHGKSSCPSDKERYSIELAARDIKELMSKLGHSCFHILGYSMGGRLALTLAVLFPEAVQSLILESASPGLKTKQERLQRQEADTLLAAKIEQEGINAFVEYWEKIPLFHTQKKLPLEKREALRKQRLQNSAVGLSRSLRGMGTGFQPSWWQKLSELTMPVLLITGTEDVKFTNIACEMSGLLQSSVWKKVNGAGHAIHVEDCAKFGTIIKEFLLHT